METVGTVDGTSFDEEVLKSPIPVVIDFWGPSCSECLKLMPVYERVAERFKGRVKFLKLNTAENRRFCIGLKVIGLPCFLIYDKGELKERIQGDLDAEALESRLLGILSALL